MSEVTIILDAIEAGDAGAVQRLLPLVYEELRRLAHAQMAAERPGQTLEATALVHEAYLRLVGSGNAVQFANSRHFFVAAGEAMRHAVAIAVELQSHVFVNQRLDGVAIVRRDDRQTSEGIGLETIDWALSRFAVQAPVGDLIEPFTCLAVHIVEVEEIAQGPEVLPDVTDATAFHFPSCCSNTTLARSSATSVTFTCRDSSPARE